MTDSSDKLPEKSEKTPDDTTSDESQTVPRDSGYEYRDPEEEWAAGTSSPVHPDEAGYEDRAEPSGLDAAVAVQEAEVSPAPPPPPPPPEDHDSADEDDEEDLGGKMTFLEHLDDLRKRLVYSCIAIGIGFVGSWAFREQIFNFIAQPILGVVENLYMTKPTEGFTIYLKVAFVSGIFLSTPVVLLQLWLFIAPGLYRKEKRYAIPFLVSSTILFLFGGAFAYYVILPPALNFLIAEMGKQFGHIITAMEYFDLVLLVLLGMGAIFQLPVLVAFLSIFGLITPGFLWRNFRYSFLLILIAAAIISPTPDPFNLFLWAAPMVALYVISIGIAWVFRRRRSKRLRDLGIED